jgi:Rps23 Pro-64 3,4-dihydroxylase Tpa1-like proline 4-hydroxylase
MALNTRFYNQGFFSFLQNQGRDNVFHFLKKDLQAKIHVVCYNHGGFYDWHRDTEFFTFNLIINDGDELQGGDMLFMDEGRIVEIATSNNLMVVFPSYINHCITPILSKSGKDVSFTQQRFSIQYWVKCS